MMKELNKAHSLDEILKSWYEGEKYYSSLLSYFKDNRFSDEAYLKIIKHINGEPQFEEEKPKKYVVQSKKTDNGGDYWYVVNTDRTFYTFHYAYSPMAKIVVKFDTREEAEKWTNPLMEVVEVEE